MADSISLRDDLYEELKADYLDNRILIFNDEVTDDVLEDYIMYILKWNRQDQDIPVEKRAEIKIYFNSVGGDTFSGNNMADVIAASKTPVWGVGFGLVASSAYHIYLSCHERYAFKNSVFLQHDGEIAIQNSTRKAQQTMDFFNEMESRSKEFVLTNTNMEESYYDDNYDKELWMHADKAKEFGIVHKIVGEDCDLEDIL